MTPRGAAAALTATVAATVAAVTAASLLADAATGLAVSGAGLVLTWAACALCWGAVGRPRPWRLVCAPFGQVAGALFLPVIASVGQGQAASAWAFVGAWLTCAGVFALTSALFAGFLRESGLSTHGGLL